MTGLLAVALALSAAASVLAVLRWLRVAQREHYLAGSVSRFALRWWGHDAVHEVLFAVALAGALASIAVKGSGLLPAVIIGLGPLGLSVRGRTSRLHWTRRLVVLSATTAMLSGLIVGLSASFAGLAGSAAAAALVAVLIPAILDLALLLVRPYEDHLAERFVAHARTRVARVAPSIVAITGSYGKTTTKGYVAHLLDGRYSVLASPRSFNNRAGLARTVNELLVPGTEVLVAEMGTYGPGEIASLCEWLPPRVAVITAIGPVHLERFKDLSRTLAAKAEITAGAEMTVLNVDDELLAGLAGELRANGRGVLACSTNDRGADITVLMDGAEVELVVAGVSIGRVEFSGAAPSAASNVACAVGAVLALGVPAEEILKRLPGLPVPDNRLKVSASANGVIILDDTFNANPAGSRLALRQLSACGSPEARRVVVTPGMIELGARQFEENAAFGRAAGKVSSDFVVVGLTNRKALLAGIRPIDGGNDSNGGRGSTPNTVVVAKRQDAVDWVRKALGPGDVVLYENDLPDHYP